MCLLVEDIDCKRNTVKHLIDRDPEMGRTTDGKFIVLFMRFNMPPPPKGNTELEALENFIKYYQENSIGNDRNKDTEESDSTNNGI